MSNFDTYGYLFSDDGKRAICKRIVSGITCCWVKWTEPNMGTRIAEIHSSGTTYDMDKALDWLHGKDVELYT